jgi:hypothetical protein
VASSVQIARDEAEEVLLGGIVLLFIGLVQDVQWLQKFLGAGENLLAMRVGNQPTVLSYTRLACGGNMTCAMAAYAGIALLLTGMFAWLAWKKRGTLSPLMVFSAATALGVLLPPYVWSYDYALLLIPICFVAFELVRRRESYLHATLFLLVLDVVSIIGLVLFWLNPESSALTIQRDMWSIWEALFVLVVTWWLVFRAPVAKPAEQRLEKSASL